MIASRQLRELRQAGSRDFDRIGMPDPKHEDWRYSDARAISALPLPVPGRPSELHVPHVDVADAGTRVFLIDGHFFVEPDSEWPGGVTVTSLTRALEDGRPAARELLGRIAPAGERALTALNSASLDDGVLIDVAAGFNLARPIHVVHVSREHPTAVATHPRVLIHVGRGARATLIESFLGDTPTAVVNAVTEVQLDPGASLEHLRWHRSVATHVAATCANVEQDGEYRLHVATTGSRLAREEVVVRLRGARASADLGGLLLGRHTDLVDHQIHIDHAAPATRSRQLFKSILTDQATGTFAGKVVVEAGARGADARQSSRALLLSEQARANAKPHLEIYTDDVRCTHGATSGQLDEDALFYLRARGLNRAEASELLVRAFAAEWAERVRDPDLREATRDWLSQWLQQGVPS